MTDRQTSTPNQPEDLRQPDPRRWKALAIILLAQFMLILDVSVVNIGLPTIRDSLDFDQYDLTWVVDAYVLMAGGLLLLGGRLSDLLGRRRVFAAGIIVFGIASVACGAAQSPGMLIASRFVQGVGEALAGPAGFGLIAVLFTDDGERGKAIGFFGGVSGLAGTSGPILGGLLIELGSWRWIFLINIPVAIVLLILLPRFIGSRFDAEKPAAGRRVDVPGAVLITAGCIGIVYAAINAAANGWGSAPVLTPLLGGAALILLFVATQAKVRNPLVPLRFFSERVRVAANVTTIFFFSVFFTQFFITTLLLQVVRGYTALQAGLAFLPFGIACGGVIGIATNLLPRLGTKPVLLTGLAFCGLAMVLFTRVTADGSFVTEVLPASIAMAIGSGLTLPSLSNAAIFRVSESEAGLAAGVQQAIQQIGGAIGLAVLLTIALRSTQGDLRDGASAAVATTNGYVDAFWVAGALMLVAFCLAAALLRSARQEAALGFAIERT